ncbi:MAG: 30S ribosomal protein S8e [Candidatus Diapherotrites archaeon]
MTQWHEKSLRKISGGIRNTKNRATKYLSQKGGEFAETTLSETEETKITKGRGFVHKVKLRKALNANVTNHETGETKKMKIVWVHENNANRLYVRRNIITKGTLIEVEKDGEKIYARVTNRPGQHGQVNAILVKKPEQEKKTARTGKAGHTGTKKKTKIVATTASN